MKRLIFYINYKGISKQLFIFLLIFICTLEKYTSELNLASQAKKEYAKANYSKALILFKKAIENGDDGGEPRFFIGTILESKREYAKSINYFIEAVERNIKKDYMIAALWKIVLYFKKTGNSTHALHYAERLKEMIGGNRRLMKIIERINKNFSPASIEARNLLIMAMDIEKKIASDKLQTDEKDSYPDEMQIAHLYERAALLDESLFHLNWKAVSYYENLKSWIDAIRVYRILLQDDKDLGKAMYKLGVIHRKIGEYQISSEYLNRVIQFEDIKPILNYYALINLSQASIALGNFQKAREYASKTFQKKFTKYKKKTGYQLMTFIFCIATYPVNGLLSYPLLKEDHFLETDRKTCDQRLSDTSFEKIRSKEYLLFYLTKAKKYHFKYVTSAKNSKNKDSLLASALDNYAKAFLNEDKKAISLKNIHNEQQNEESINKQFTLQWVFSELPYVARLFYENKEFYMLDRLVHYYQYFLEDEKNFWHWKLESAYYIGDYQIAIDSILQVNVRSKEYEKKLLSSYSYLKDWNSLKNEAKNYIRSYKDQRNDILSYIKNDSSFKEFRNQKNYSTFIQNLENDIYLLEPKIDPQPQIDSQLNKKIVSENKKEVLLNAETEEKVQDK